MRSFIAAATLTLATGLVSPAFAQLTPPKAPGTESGFELAPRGDDRATQSEAKPNTKSVKGESKAAKAAKGEAKPAKSDDTALAPPPAPGVNAVPPPGGRNVTATGRTMPPATGRGGAAPVKTSTEIEMLKAQKAAEERNKAWDDKMRRTMSTICNGC